MRRSTAPVLAAVVCVTAALVAGCQPGSTGAPGPSPTARDTAEHQSGTASATTREPVATMPGTTTRAALPSTPARRT
ncbi:MAG TPA: hypothetical protein VFM37_10745, partial [Pseudonocardiaceae bacterium]|nr:hypothetical protein [Pseudonocardiaceae bacterium]